MPEVVSSGTWHCENLQPHSCALNEHIRVSWTQHGEMCAAWYNAYILEPLFWTSRCDNISAELKITVNSQLKFIVTVNYSLQHVLSKFNVYGSVHRKYIPVYIQQDATSHSPFISGNCSTCFGWYLHPSSGAHTTVFTASGICQTVTAICRYRGRVGTGLSEML